MNTEELSLLVEETDAIGQVPLIEGLHGIGKTETVYQYAKSKGMHLEPLILSLMDTGDLLGLPDTVELGGIKTTVWSSPDWYTHVVNYAWPPTLLTSALVFNDEELKYHFTEAGLLYKTKVTRTEVNKAYSEYYGLPEDMMHILNQDNLQYSKGVRSVLLLDELNRTHPDILNAILQLILEKRLHSHVLPRVMGKDTALVATINPSGKQYTVSEFDPALLDRFVLCKLEADLSAWKKWAKKQGVEEVVIDFLSSHSTRFHYEPEEGKGTSPRTWVGMSNYLKSIKGKPKNGLSNYAKGKLGITTGVEFTVFVETASNTLTAKELEKLICSTIRSNTDVKDLGELVEMLSEPVDKLDNTQLIDYTAYFKEHYINADSSIKFKPLLVFLYCLPLEILSTVLKDCKTNDSPSYKIIARMDKELNGSELFLKLTRNVVL